MSPPEVFSTRYNIAVLIGSTVHVVPIEGGLWQVVDPRRQVFTFPSKAAAVQQAKAVAAARQPSQVVLFDELGHLVPIAHYQLPQYPTPHDNQAAGSVFEAAVKALVIGGLLAAGVAVLGELVDKVDRELEKETSRSKGSTRRKRRSP
jgi:hypothetical protein